jgi:putative transposase
MNAKGSLRESLMKLTVKYKLELDAEQERHLSNLCHYATKLYNTDNYQRRKIWVETGKIPNAYAQKKTLRERVWFKLLPSQTAQEVSFVLQQNYKSWFVLRKMDKEANPPRFRKKTMLSPITFYQQFKMVGDTVELVLSRKYREEQNIKRLCLRFNGWKKLQGKPKMCQVLKAKDEW